MVDVREFITDLFEDLRLALIGDRPIARRAEVDAGLFPFAQAVTLGLIVSGGAILYHLPVADPWP